MTRYAESGLTQREFCGRNGVGLSTLGRWLRQLAREAEPEPPVFMEANMQQDGRAALALGYSDAGGRCFKVSLGSGREIEVASGFDPQELAMLLRVVEER